MNEIESGIINVLKQDVPLRAREIAKALRVTRREVNHYLYTSLKGLVIQDKQCKWRLKMTTQTVGEQLSLPFERQQEQSPLNELLRLHQQSQRKAALDKTLKSLIDSPQE
jgi:hypothetical protein